MLKRIGRGLTGIFDRRVLRRWNRLADLSPEMEAEALKSARTRARALRRRLDRLLHAAEGRLALPLVGASGIRKPLYSDWAYRPELWRGPVTPPGIAAVDSKTRLGQEATLFHDCARSEITLRQIRNTREEDLAPFGVRLDVFRFDGSFLSLVLDLPHDAAAGLKKRHLVRLDIIVETEKPLEIFARLNVKHGPNTEQIVRELPMHESDRMVEFDLAYTNLNEKRVERMWVDLIFEGPEMNQVVLRDVTLSRRPRAEI
jgi:hypothetical protein